MPSLVELEQEAHLWMLRTRSCEAHALLACSASVLSPEERERAKRFAFEKDRRSYICAHWLLRVVLSKYLPHPPASWRFERGLFGKPKLNLAPQGPQLHFNLSHAAGMVVCGVSCAGELGVDVETVRPRDHLKLAQRFFAPEEFAQLITLDEEQQMQAFFRFWTLKEAYIKAKGKGLSMDLASFAFREILAEEITVTFLDEGQGPPEDWQFFRHEPDDLHKIALGIQSVSRSPVALKIFSTIPPSDSDPELLQYQFVE